VIDCVVLGCGLVGLLAAYLIEADVLIGRSAGVSALSRFLPGFVRRGEAIVALARELGLPTGGRTARVVDLDRTRERSVEEFDATRFDREDLARKLLNRMEPTVGEVTAVEIRRTDGRELPRVRVAVSGGREVWTRQVVNALPAPAFDTVRRHEDVFNRAVAREWTAPETTLIRVPVATLSERVRRALEEPGAVGVRAPGTDASVPFERVWAKGDEAILEIRRPELVPTGGAWGEIPTLRRAIHPKGASRDPVEHAGTVLHVGRLARWDRRIGLNEVARDLLAYREEASR
jgi:hypothetical protein